MKKPNVIIVLTDDQGYGDFSCHGNPVVKTPNIDKLYNESIRLTDFHVAPMCAPTRGQIMTGRNALANGAYNVYAGQSFIRRGIPTMAEIFFENGYHTGHFGKWHLGENFPYRPQDRGFEEVLYFRGSCITASSDYWQNDCFNDYYWHNSELKQYEGYCTDVWFDEAMKWMKSCKEKAEPFFVYLCPNAPHHPHFVPEKYREPYKNQEYPRTGKIYDTAGFFGMIANIDENMGRLEAMLRKTGLAENTILIFMTDNGGTAGTGVFNAGMRGQKCSLYDGGHRVPCFVRWPMGDLTEPCDVGLLTHCQDLLPTLIDLCGLEQPRGICFDGTSFALTLRGQEQDLSERMLVVQYSWRPVDRLPQKWNSAVMWNYWRLIKGEELYHIKEDPSQEKDVAGLYPDIVEKMRNFYEKWWSAVEPGLSEINYISIGVDVESPVFLSSHDWFETRCGHNQEVLAGIMQKGPWNIMVEQEGIYAISLSRWPKEADLPITAGCPAFEPQDKTQGTLYYQEGKALPIGFTRIKIGDVDEMKEVKKGEKVVNFTVKLNKGQTQLQTWFYDKSCLEAWGAFYVYVQYNKTQSK